MVPAALAAPVRTVGPTALQLLGVASRARVLRFWMDAYAYGSYCRRASAPCIGADEENTGFQLSAQASGRAGRQPVRRRPARRQQRGYQPRRPGPVGSSAGSSKKETQKSPLKSRHHSHSPPSRQALPRRPQRAPRRVCHRVGTGGSGYPCRIGGERAVTDVSAGTTGCKLSMF